MANLAEAIASASRQVALMVQQYMQGCAGTTYPVGSIYLSVTATDPANFFGGTWERIEDRFLLAAGGTYAPGSTGGKAEHTLTVDELPSHKHQFSTYGGSIVNVSTSTSGTPVGKGTQQVFTGATGGGAAHNNMPPYLAVYVWKRVA